MFKKTLCYLAVGLLLFLALLPLFWSFVTSFKYRQDICTYPPSLRFTPTFENYIIAVKWYNLISYLKNSIVVSTFSTVLVLMLSGCVAYAIARFTFAGRKKIMLWILTLRMLPPIVAAVPLYLLFKELRLLDTYPSLILPYFSYNVPLAVWLLYGFFKSIPKELEESALVDGGSPLTVLLKITLPIALPGVLVTFLFCFTFSWNEFLYALIFTTENARTIAPSLLIFRGSEGIRWGPMCAASTIALTPVLIITIFLRRYIIKGFTLGLLK